MNFIDTLRVGLNTWQIDYTEEQIEKLVAFNRMMMAANEHMNLTAIPDGAPSAKKHFLDSLNPPALSMVRSAKSVIDVGSGAGFPGIPLSIMCPEVSFTLMDSRQKRIAFLDEVIAIVGISNAKTLLGRAESIGQDESHREQYDVACARAVASLPTLLEYLLPFVKIGGHTLCYKGTEVDDEIQQSEVATKTLGGDELILENYTLFSEKQKLSIITTSKICATSTKYPRKPGKPAKYPIR